MKPVAHATPESAAPMGCTNFKLRRLTRRVTQHYDQYLSAQGLKITQYSLLTHIDKLGPLPPGELSRHMEMDASTLTRNLKPLEAAGWVEVGPGTDGRRRLVHLTDSGRERRQAAQRQWKAAQLALNQKLGTPTVHALHELLDKGLAAFYPGC